VALLAAEGFALPVPVAVGMSDAAQLFHTAGGALPRGAPPPSKQTVACAAHTTAPCSHAGRRY
jgi:hypothetical protein